MSTEKEDGISKFLGMRSIDEVVEKKNEIMAYRENLPVESPNAYTDPRKDEDFERARDTVNTVIEYGTTAVQEMANIAEQSQNAMAYEKLGALMNSVVAASKTLMDLHKRKKEIDKVDLDNPSLREGEGQAQVVNQNLFVGSTAELQDMIENLRKKDEETPA